MVDTWHCEYTVDNKRVCKYIVPAVYFVYRGTTTRKVYTFGNLFIIVIQSKYITYNIEVLKVYFFREWDIKYRYLQLASTYKKLPCKSWLLFYNIVLELLLLDTDEYISFKMRTKDTHCTRPQSWVPINIYYTNSITHTYSYLRVYHGKFTLRTTGTMDDDCIGPAFDDDDRTL